MAGDARLPVIAVAMGDPAGIGPEIVVKALSHEAAYRLCRPLVVADAAAIQQATEIAGIPLTVRPVREPTEARFKHGLLDVLDMRNVPAGSVTVGNPSPAGAKAAFQCLARSVEMASNRVVQGITAAPVTREALRHSGAAHASQSDAIAALARSARWAAMLFCGPLRVALCTPCVSVRQAIDQLDRNRVLTVIRLTNGTLQRLGIPRPRIAVTGVNPAADRNGPGEEEQHLLMPAIQLARDEGIDAQGPLPASLAIPQATEGQFDAVVAMYCDQAQIAVRLLNFRLGPASSALPAAATLMGMAMACALPDQGPSFETAGRGIASEESMRLALELCARLSR